MSAALLSELTRRGFTLRRAHDGTLRCSPKHKLTEEDAVRIKENKGGLLRLLANEQNLSSPIVLSSSTPTKADTYGESLGDDTGDDTDESIVPQFVLEERERRRKEAEALGLVARWSYEFGYIAVHDPITGEWHDLPTKDVPDWAKREAFKRKELKKYRGITRLLTSVELEEVYREEREQAEGEEGIVEDDGAVDERGIVYEDYLG